VTRTIYSASAAISSGAVVWIVADGTADCLADPLITPDGALEEFFDLEPALAAALALQTGHDGCIMIPIPAPIARAPTVAPIKAAKGIPASSAIINGFLCRFCEIFR
jgi:hypothetical protein